MLTVIPITDFRKNIFTYADFISQQEQPVEIQRDGVTILKVIPVKDDPAARAKYVLEHVLPKLSAAWKNVPTKEFDQVNEFMRGKKEKNYWQRKRFKW